MAEAADAFWVAGQVHARGVVGEVDTRRHRALTGGVPSHRER